MSRLIVLIGQRVRSGTNFIGSTIAQHKDVCSIPTDTSIGEFNLFRSRDIIDNVFKEVSEKSFASGIKKSDEDSFLQLYGQSWLSLLEKKNRLKKNEVIFIKSPIIENWDLWRRAFPDTKIVFLCRDGRDNTISSVKASNDKRNWHSALISIKKRVNFYSGRYFYNTAKHWASTADIFHNVVEDKNTMKIRYEDLINSSENIKKLLNFYEIDSSEESIKKCLNAPVMGSSWGVDKKSTVKPNWTPDYNRKKYKFTNKWKKWGSFKRFVFKKIGGKQLINLGYEKELNW